MAFIPLRNGFFRGKGHYLVTHVTFSFPKSGSESKAKVKGTLQ